MRALLTGGPGDNRKYLRRSAPWDTLLQKWHHAQWDLRKVTGEAGASKSRIIDAIRNWMRPTDVKVMRTVQSAE
jgi:hypothetical protein